MPFFIFIHFSDFSRINQTLAEDIRVGATIVTVIFQFFFYFIKFNSQKFKILFPFFQSDIIGIILSKVYDKLTFNVADFVPFNELTCDASKLKHLIQQTLDADGERFALYLLRCLIENIRS